MHFKIYTTKSPCHGWSWLLSHCSHDIGRSRWTAATVKGKRNGGCLCSELMDGQPDDGEVQRIQAITLCSRMMACIDW